MKMDVAGRGKQSKKLCGQDACFYLLTAGV